MSQIVLLSLICLLNLAVAAVLTWKYIRTRESGFIILGVAVLIWPRVSSPLERSALQVLGGLLGGVFPFSLIAKAQVTVGELLLTLREIGLIVGAALLLLAVLYPSKTKTHANGTLP